MREQPASLLAQAIPPGGSAFKLQLQGKIARRDPAHRRRSASRCDGATVSHLAFAVAG